MNVDFVRLSPEHSLRDAIEQMSGRRERYAAVISEEAFVGLVCDRDLRLALPSRLRRPLGRWSGSADDGCLIDDTSVMSVCIRRPFTAHPRGSAIASAQFMLHKQVGCLPIVDDASGLLGLLTLRDFARIFAAFAIGGGPALAAPQDAVVS